MCRMFVCASLSAQYGVARGRCAEGMNREEGTEEGRERDARGRFAEMHAKYPRTKKPLREQWRTQSNRIDNGMTSIFYIDIFYEICHGCRILLDRIQ